MAQRFHRLATNFAKRRFSDTPSASSTNLNFFENSKTCSIVKFNGRPIYILGDKDGSNTALDRIVTSIKEINPCAMLLESETISSQTWRLKNPKGKVIKDSYLSLYSKYYPNLGNQMSDYQQSEIETHASKASEYASDLLKENIIWAGENLSTSLTSKSKSGEMESFVVQFKEEHMREELKNRIRASSTSNKKRRKPTPDRPPVSFTGPLDSEDEKEMLEQFELEQEMVKDLENLSNQFNGIDILLSDIDFNKIRNIVYNGNFTQNDILLYEKLNDKTVVRRFVLNEIARSLVTNAKFQKINKDLWHTMRLLYASRDRSLIRFIRQECDKLDNNNIQGPILAIVNLGHVFSIEKLWNDEQFWKGEEDAMAWVKSQSNIDQVHSDLRKMGLPFVDDKPDGNNDSLRF